MPETTPYTNYLTPSGDVFRNGVEIATLDPFHGYKNAMDDQLVDAIAVFDAFHVVKLVTAAVDESAAVSSKTSTDTTAR